MRKLNLAEQESRAFNTSARGPPENKTGPTRKVGQGLHIFLRLALPLKVYDPSLGHVGPTVGKDLLFGGRSTGSLVVIASVTVSLLWTHPEVIVQNSSFKS